MEYLAEISICAPALNLWSNRNFSERIRKHDKIFYSTFSLVVCGAGYIFSTHSFFWKRGYELTELKTLNMECPVCKIACSRGIGKRAVQGNFNLPDGAFPINVCPASGRLLEVSKMKTYCLFYSWSIIIYFRFVNCLSPAMCLWAVSSPVNAYYLHSMAI